MPVPIRQIVDPDFRHTWRTRINDVVRSLGRGTSVAMQAGEHLLQDAAVLLASIHSAPLAWRENMGFSS